MKNLKLKDWTGLAVAAAMGITAFIGALSDREKNQKMDDLIEKVEKLTTEEK